MKRKFSISDFWGAVQLVLTKVVLTTPQVCIVLFILCFVFCNQSFAQTASWYSTEACQFNKNPKCPTASGKSLYDLEAQNVYFAASWDYRLGEEVCVTNIENGKSVVVRIEDRGPARRLYDRGRVIDLGIRAFEELASTKKGIIEVKLGEV